MGQANQDPKRQPMLARHSVEPPRLVTDAAPTQGMAAGDEIGSLERRVLFGSSSGIELHYPARLVWPSPWVGHIPFAFWLVEAIRPRVVVELGVHSGNSYCAFLQAIQSLALTAQCYGIDHWRGDEHSDRYGDDVYAELCSYHDPLYGPFSTLIRATFEEALPYFPDRCVDLLHIDGFHTYDAVAKDFSDWLPKLSARGVVLFHDINVREREFGVWRFWEEVAARHPTLAFVHSHGLGLAYPGSEPPPVSLRPLLAMSDPDGLGRIRSYFARLGMSLVDRFERRQAERIADRVRASETELETARAEIRRHVQTAEAFRIQVEDVTARVPVLDAELAAARAEVERKIEAAARLQQEFAAWQAESAGQTEVAARLQQELSASRAEAADHAESAARVQQQLSASRAEAARQSEAVARLQQEISASRAEAASQAESAARVQQQLSASRAETARQTEAVARLQQELSVSRTETTRQTEAAGDLQRQCSEARSELARQTAVASVWQLDAQKATERIALLEDELEAARAEIARQLDAAHASRAAIEQVTEQVAVVREELVRARGQMSEAIAQRERATQLLRQQITATAALQRELAPLRQSEAVAAFVNRLTTVKHMIPRPVKQYIKNRVRGLPEP